MRPAIRHRPGIDRDQCILSNAFGMITGAAVGRGRVPLHVFFVSQSGFVAVAPSFAAADRDGDKLSAVSVLGGWGLLLLFG